MGNVYQYFSAPDDGSAMAAFTTGPVAAGFPALDVNGVDPHLLLGAAEALLVDRPYEEVAARPRSSRLLSDPEADRTWVVTLTDRLRDALAGASAQRLADVAVPWSGNEEFQGRSDPRALAGFLGQLAVIARQGRDRGHRLYCWRSL